MFSIFWFGFLYSTRSKVKFRRFFKHNPLLSDTRVNALADLLGLFYIAQTGVVAAYMGATAYMAGKPMGNKIAMKKDMR